MFRPGGIQCSAQVSSIGPGVHIRCPFFGPAGGSSGQCLSQLSSVWANCPVFDPGSQCLGQVSSVLAG